MQAARHDIPVEPKAGKVGTISVVVFAVLYILVAFAALYMYFDADFGLAAATAIASIIVPITVGFFVTEIVHQRAGALCFVLTAAVLTGAISAWALGEAENFEDRREWIAPDVELSAP